MAAGGISAGEVGGIVAGIIAVLATLGGGIKFMLNWKARREDSRAHRLQKWHEELQARELRLNEEQAAHFARIERELGDVRGDQQQMKREQGALRNAYQLIAGALRRIDPENIALGLADELLKAAFTLDPVVPADWGQLTEQIK
jgi:hypothetical protein